MSLGVAMGRGGVLLAVALAMSPIVSRAKGVGCQLAGVYPSRGSC